MIIIKVKGRLGNQMFDYALLKQLKSLGKDVKLDFSQLYIDGIKNELQIFNNLDYEEATNSEISRLGDCKKDILSKLRRGLGYRKKSHVYEQNMTFMENIFEMDNVYLEGFWQSEKYFPDIRDLLLKDYSFNRVEEENIINQIQETMSVSIHIRRGDYLEKRFRKIYGGICSFKYYNSAISYFENKFKNVHFFVFSDDPKWAKNVFKDYKFSVLEGNTGNKSYLDMYLMSQCKHNIIANSSFSWWGAWLNQNPDKIIIAPDRWLNNCDAFDIYDPKWIRMGSN